MARILIVEDEPAMRMGLKDNFEFESYEVELAIDGAEGLEKIKNGRFDLIILDVMMPKMSGFDVCKAVRKLGVLTPIIFLTAKSEEIDKVLGLELGADDYLTKPFSLRELIARVKAILRRTGATAAATTSGVQQLGRLSVDLEQYTASLEGEPVRMSHKEYEILQFLMEKKNEVVSRYDLLNKVWGYESQPTTRTVDNFILRLRQRIEENPNDPKVILTVHGVGYKMLL
ncbi:MAG: response regulator transcription factor [Roseivirga sp.]|nr:response regulator transcription factor [Roseivirga sp.]